MLGRTYEKVFQDKGTIRIKRSENKFFCLVFIHEHKVYPFRHLQGFSPQSLGDNSVSRDVQAVVVPAIHYGVTPYSNHEPGQLRSKGADYNMLLLSEIHSQKKAHGHGNYQNDHEHFQKGESGAVF